MSLLLRRGAEEEEERVDSLFSAQPDGVSGRVYMGNSNLAVNGFPVTLALGYNRTSNNGFQYVMYGQTGGTVSGVNYAISDSRIYVFFGSGNPGSTSSYRAFYYNRTHTLEAWQHYIIELVDANTCNLYINDGSALTMTRDTTYTSTTYNWADARYYFFYRAGFNIYSNGFKIYNPRLFYGSLLSESDRTKVVSNNGLVGSEIFSLNKKEDSNWEDQAGNFNGAITETVTFEEL